MSARGKVRKARGVKRTYLYTSQQACPVLDTGRAAAQRSIWTFYEVVNV